MAISSFMHGLRDCGHSLQDDGLGSAVIVLSIAALEYLVEATPVTFIASKVAFCFFALMMATKHLDRMPEADPDRNWRILGNVFPLLTAYMMIYGSQ